MRHQKLSREEELEKMRAFSEELAKDPVRLKAFLRKVMGPPRRVLEGDEYEKIATLISLMDPYHSSNNQRTMTDRYRIGTKRYDVTYGVCDIPEIEEVDDSDEI